MKWDLDLWYELWDRAGSQGLDNWYDLRGEAREGPALDARRKLYWIRAKVVLGGT